MLCSWHGASTAPGLQRLVALGFALLCLLLEQHPSVTDWGFFFFFFLFAEVTGLAAHMEVLIIIPKQL